MPDPRAPKPFFSRLRAWLVHGKADAHDIPAFIGALLGAVLVGIPAVVYLIVPLFAVLETMRTSAGIAPQDEGDRALFARFSMLAYVAVIGLALAWWRNSTAERQVRAQNRTLEQTAESLRLTAESLRLTEARNLTDNFTKAIELLGARVGAGDGEPALELRLGAIYALERIARDNLDYHIQIMETLCAYVRQHAPAIPGEVFPGAVLRDLEDEKPDITDEEVYSHPAFVAALAPLDAQMRERFTVGFLRDSREGHILAWSDQSLPALEQWLKTRPRPREDIRATLDVIGRRGEKQRRHEAGRDFQENPYDYNGYRLDLRNTRLSHISPTEKAFDYALFQDAQMEGADFSMANLKGASLRGARVEASIFFKARMPFADFRDARMERASFHEAWIGWALFFNARLERANFNRARLEGARFGWSSMEGVDFSDTLLNGSEHSPITFNRANLAEAINTSGALRFADFSEAIVEATFFANAFGDGSVVLTEGMARPPHWSDTVLDDATFFGRWRGWVEAGPWLDRWPMIAPYPYLDVTAIPPPDGLTWEHVPRW